VGNLSNQGEGGELICRKGGERGLRFERREREGQFPFSGKRRKTEEVVSHKERER